MQLPPETILIADSGGFQSPIHGTPFTPQEVLSWYESNNITRALILDCPTEALMTNTRNQTDFDDSKRRTIENTRYMKDHKTKSNLKLYSVLQGYRDQDLVGWYESLQKEDLLLDGISLPARPANMYGIMLRLGFLINHGHKRIHLLALSGIRTLPILIYANKLIDDLSCDSSTSLVQGSQYRQYYVQETGDTLALTTLKDSVKGKSSFVKFFRERLCDCPVCRVVEGQDWINATSEQNGFSGGTVIGMHDLYFFLKLIKLFETLLESEKYYMNNIRRFCGKKGMECIEAFNYCLNHGFDKAFQKYKQQVYLSQIQSPQTVNLENM
jgi:queuine/archaeosine tRNA-ribosyltransferase